MAHRGVGIVGALSVTETVSWGILYYAFAVFLLPMQRELGFSTAELTGAFSLALLVSARRRDRASAAISTGTALAALMTAGSIAGASRPRVVAGPRARRVLRALDRDRRRDGRRSLRARLHRRWPSGSRDADERRRAMTALTLVAALRASSSSRSRRR